MLKVYYYDSIKCGIHNKDKLEQSEITLMKCSIIKMMYGPETKTVLEHLVMQISANATIPSVVPDVDLLKRYKVLNDNTIQFEEIDNAFDIKFWQVIMVSLWEVQDAQLNFTNICKDNNCYVLFDYVYETYHVPKVFCVAV